MTDLPCPWCGEGYCGDACTQRRAVLGFEQTAIPVKLGREDVDEEGDLVCGNQPGGWCCLEPDHDGEHMTPYTKVVPFGFTVEGARAEVEAQRLGALRLGEQLVERTKERDEARNTLFHSSIGGLIRQRDEAVVALAAALVVIEGVNDVIDPNRDRPWQKKDVAGTVRWLRDAREAADEAHAEAEEKLADLRKAAEALVMVWDGPELVSSADEDALRAAIERSR